MTYFQVFLAISKPLISIELRDKYNTFCRHNDMELLRNYFSNAKLYFQMTFSLFNVYPWVTEELFITRPRNPIKPLGSMIFVLQHRFTRKLFVLINIIIIITMSEKSQDRR